MEIKVQNLSLTYSSSHAPLFNIKSLTIPRGSKILIKGASGKGKTTLLHMFAGLLLPQYGTILLDNIELNSLSEKERSKLRRTKLGIVFQKLNLLEHLSVLENVMLGLNAEKRHKETKAEQALQRLNMLEKRYFLSAQLSLGEQQRTAVARVLAVEPSLILADEPTSSLDDLNCKDVLDALLHAADKNTLVVVSHDQRIECGFDKVINFEEFAAV